MVKVSVIIPSFNCSEYLDLCLQSIEKTTKFEDDEVEVIVVLDGCTDNSKEVASKYSWAKVIDLKNNVGLSNALNYGVLWSSGEFVFLLNDDMVFPKKWAKRLVPLMANNNVICPQLLEPGTVPVAKNLVHQNFGDTAGNFDITSFWRYEEAHREEKLILGDKNYPLLMRRILYLAIGGHDPNMSHSDIDFYLKLSLFNIQVNKSLDASFYHFSGKSMKKNFNSNEQALKNKTYLMKKWRLTGHEQITLSDSPR